MLEIIGAIVIAFLIILFLPLILRASAFLLLVILAIGAVGVIVWAGSQAGPAVLVLAALGALVFLLSSIFSANNLKTKSTSTVAAKERPRQVSPEVEILAHWIALPVGVLILGWYTYLSVSSMQDWVLALTVSLVVAPMFIVFSWKLKKYKESSRSATWSRANRWLLLSIWLNRQEFASFLSTFFAFRASDTGRLNRRQRLNHLIDQAKHREKLTMEENRVAQEKKDQEASAKAREDSAINRAVYRSNKVKTFRELHDLLTSECKAFIESKIITVSADESSLSIDINTAEGKAVATLTLISTENGEDIKEQPLVRVTSDSSEAVTPKKSVRVVRKMLKRRFF